MPFLSCVAVADRYKIRSSFDLLRLNSSRFKNILGLFFYYCSFVTVFYYFSISFYIPVVIRSMAQCVAVFDCCR